MACSEPCSSDCGGCSRGYSCENQLQVSLVEPLATSWLGGQHRGLFASGGCPAKSWVATFGPLRKAGRGASFSLHVTAGRRSHAGGAWHRRKTELAPLPSWEVDGHYGPLVNHSCCPAHINCEFVVPDRVEDIDRPFSVWVRTTKHVSSGEELLAHYGTHAFSKPEQCACCLCQGLCVQV